MALSSTGRIALVLVATATLGLAGAAVAVTAATASDCSDVDVVFARGTTEPQGFGMLGTPLVRAIKSNLRGKTVSSYAVKYAARVDQSSAGPGATDMTKHITAVAARCRKTAFVIGGYSQGATVTDISIGIKTVFGKGETIANSLAPRVKAVVVFGNPLRMVGGSINQRSQLYGPRALDQCASGDPVCGGGLNFVAHMQYLTNGSITKAARFAADRVKGKTRAVQSSESSQQ